MQNQTIKLDSLSGGGIPTPSNAGKPGKDNQGNSIGQSAFQGRSKSQSNTAGLEDLLKLPRANRLHHRPWENSLMSPKENVKNNLEDKKSSTSPLNSLIQSRRPIKSVRSSTDPTEMVPCCQLNISQLETAKDANLESSQNQTSLAWLFTKRSVFEILSQDAVRRQRKWRKQSEDSGKRSKQR